MKYYLLAMFGILFSLLFFAKGITGYVVGESCCFPPNCEPENICDVAKAPAEESPQGFSNSPAFFLIGASALLAVSMYIMSHSRHDH